MLLLASHLSAMANVLVRNLVRSLNNFKDIRGKRFVLLGHPKCSSERTNFADANVQEQDISTQSVNDISEYRFFYPEFLPDPTMNQRHAIREKLERTDMLRRRRVLEIPEFYVGSIMAITASDQFAPGKKNRFVGICVLREGHGLRAHFILRNVIDRFGVEVMYELYNPSIQKIEVLKLEKRTDDQLLYLRDALPEYSTFPFDMVPVPHPEGNPVPVNPIKVKMKPMPWYAKWERENLKGVQDLGLEQKYYDRAKEVAKPWEKYDLMKQYRNLIPEEQQMEIMEEIDEHH
ncbi:MRPL19 (predicted), partial [Pycnogonum litorale]